MTDIERDHVLRRAVQTLRQLPAADTDAIRRVVEAAAAERVMPAADEPSDESAPPRGAGRRWRRLVGFGGLIAAAAIAGFVVRGSVPREGRVSELPSEIASNATLHSAANSVASADALPIAQQFVFRSTSARRVSVVGDFNRWNSAASPMLRSPGGDLWSVTIPIAPGRHAYAFMVDDSVFTLDPDLRVARVRDPDLGAEGSVVIVGRP